MINIRKLNELRELFKKNLLQLNIATIGFDVLIISTSIIGMIKSIEWINKNTSELKNASIFYYNISEVVDIQIMGWLLLVSCFLLLISVFIRTPNEFRLMILGGLVSGLVYFAFGILAVDNASLYATYYNNLINGWVQIIIAGMGAIGIWKTKV